MGHHHTQEEKDMFTSVKTSLHEIQENRELFEKHANTILLALKNQKVYNRSMEKQLKKITSEEENINHKAEKLLDTIEDFTTQSLLKAKSYALKSEKTSLTQLMLMITCFSILFIALAIMMNTALIKKVKRLNNDLHKISTDLNESSHTVSSSSEQMSENLQVITIAMREMSESISLATQQAVEGAEVSLQADEKAKETNKIVVTLGESASKITTVTETISKIADQTNLLALNAAIEAAGAGKAGVGFSVVANEVKELARQASKNAEDIQEKITQIQTSTHLSIEAIQNILSTIANINEINASIASAMEEQSIAANDISSNVNETAEASRKVTGDMMRLSLSNKNESSLSKKLQDIATEYGQL